VLFIGISAGVAIAIGLAQGFTVRLESRHGALWGQLPVQALWLWLAQAHVIGARAVTAGIPFAPEKDGKSWPDTAALQLRR
jgi:K+-transporting ATPase A subunit